MRSITQIVEDVMAQAKDYGSEQSTVNMMYYGIFKPIINRHDKEGLSEYTPSIVEDFRAEYEDRLSKHDVSQSHMATVRRALQYLTSCADSGRVDFSRAKKPLKIIASDYHMSLVDECMGSVCSGDGHSDSINIFMRHFFCFIESMCPDCDIITDEMIRAFILDASVKYPKSIGYVMQSVRILTDYLRSKNLLTGSMDFSVFSPKAPPTIMQEFYTEDEVDALLSATGDDPIGKRNKAMILLGYGNGFRAGDVVNLTRKDIDWKSGEIHIVQGKTAIPLKLTLNSTTMNAIADYILNGRPECEYDNVFLTVARPHRPLVASGLSTMMTTLSKKAGVAIIPGRSFHGLRRSYAINLAEAGTELDLISQMLGHQTFECDRQYLTFNREQTFFCAMDFSMVPITAGAYYIATQGGEKK